MQGNSLGELLVNVAEYSSDKFFFVIDEWDVLFREYKEKTKLQDGHQSAISDFREYTMIQPSIFEEAHSAGTFRIYNSLY